MKTWIAQLVVISAMLASWSTTAPAQNVGAVASGDWSNASIWTLSPPGIPGPSNSVYIGSNNSPTGSVATATVTVSAAESALNVYLGNGGGTDGTLDLAGGALTIGNNLSIGNASGAIGAITERGGSFTATNAIVNYGNSLTFGGGDAVTNLYLNNSSGATTIATGNVTNTVSVQTGSTLNLGASLNLTANFGSTLNVQDAGSTLNMGGQAVDAISVLLGVYGSSTVKIENQGTITVTNGDGSLSLGNGMAYKLLANDSVTNLNLYSGSAATTAATGNITENASVTRGSTLTLGANLILTQTLNVQDKGSTLNMGGHTVTADSLVELGWGGNSPVTILNQGTLTTPTLWLGNDTAYHFLSTDAVRDLQLQTGATATTSATGNLTNSVNVFTGSTLNLGANLSLSSNLNVQDAGSTLDMNGHAINGDGVYLGSNGDAPVTIQNQGTLTLNSLFLGNGTTYNLQTADKLTNLQMQTGAIATTSATSNVTGSVSLLSDSTLTAHADLDLMTGSLNIQDGSTLNMTGHAITASGGLTLGFGDRASSSGNLLNNGSVQVGEFLGLGHGSTLTLHGGDSIIGGGADGGIALQQGSVLTVVQSNGIGLSIDGGGTLSIDGTSHMDLMFHMNTGPNWVFRWTDEVDSNWVSQIQSMINAGEIVVSAPQGYSVDNRGGYTYIDGLYSSSVPEPSSLVLAFLASVGVTLGVTWQRRRRARR